MELSANRRTQLLVDLWVADAQQLDNLDYWKSVLHEAARRIGAAVLGEGFHVFEPHGITGYLLLAESHLSVHTWPEERLAVIDIFSCSAVEMEPMLGWLRRHVQPVRSQVIRVERGSLDPLSPFVDRATYRRATGRQL